MGIRVLNYWLKDVVFLERELSVFWIVFVLFYSPVKPQDFYCFEEKKDMEEDFLTFLWLLLLQISIQCYLFSLFCHVTDPEGAIEICYNERRFFCRYMWNHPNCCVVDPLDNIYPLLDRLRIQQILIGLEDIYSETRCRICAPHFLKVFLL